MRSLIVLTILLKALCATPSSLFSRDDLKGFTVARAGEASDIVITEDNTLNGTYHNDQSRTITRFISTTAAAVQMPFEFINNFSGGQVKAYIQGLDPEEKVVFIKSDGSLFYPSSGGSTTPVEIANSEIAITLPGRGQKFRINLPIPIQSGRVYFSEGELKFYMVKTAIGDGLVQPSVANPADPSSETNWGFIEFTNTKEGTIYANISYVDFVGMILSMSLSAKDNSETQLTKGLNSGAVSTVCGDLVKQSKADGRNWGALCVANRSGKVIRVLSPNIYAVMRPDDFKDYWQGYINKVWQEYSNKPLIVDTQGPAGKVNCRVSGNRLKCDGDNRAYDKPTAKDIWGCEGGPFGKIGGDNGVHLAVMARLCAAFVRSTLLVAGGNVQPKLPQTSYYKTSPTNHYSRLVHKQEVDGKGYAFAYDDVNPDGENAFAAHSNEMLTVYFFRGWNLSTSTSRKRFRYIAINIALILMLCSICSKACASSEIWGVCG